MSAITYDWAPFEIEVGAELATHRPMEIKSRIGREEEFRSALNTYLAEYRKIRDAVALKTTHQSLKNQIPLGHRTAEMLMYQPWF